MKAILYIRVSTNKQEHSPEVQLSKLQAYCTLKDYQVIEVIEDHAKSGKSIDRPGLQRALQLLQAGGDGHVLVVAKLDRLTRSIADLCRLLETCERERWTFASISEEFNTGTPMGRFVLKIFGAIAEWERETISERTSEVMQELKSKGVRHCNNAPYGYKWGAGNELEIEPGEQGVLAEIVSLIDRGASYSDAAMVLNSMGYRTRMGTGWSKQMVGKRIKQLREVVCAS